jgi:hypothetical protein
MRRKPGVAFRTRPRRILKAPPEQGRHDPDPQALRTARNRRNIRIP